MGWYVVRLCMYVHVYGVCVLGVVYSCGEGREGWTLWMLEYRVLMDYMSPPVCVCVHMCVCVYICVCVCAWCVFISLPRVPHYCMYVYTLASWHYLIQYLSHVYKIFHTDTNTLFNTSINFL